MTKRFNMENTEYTQVELDELNRRFELAVEAEVESWDHTSERYRLWMAGWTNENDAEHLEWIADIETSILRDYEDITPMDIDALRQEAGRAGDGDMVLTCSAALNGNEGALDRCREVIFDTRCMSEEG